MASRYGIGPGFGLGNNGAANSGIIGGQYAQFPRQQHLPPTPNLLNNFNQPMGDFGTNRFPSVFVQSKFPTTRQPTTSTASSSCAETPSPTPILFNQGTMFTDSNAHLSTIAGNWIADVGIIILLTTDCGLIEKTLDTVVGASDEASNERGASSSPKNNDDNNNQNARNVASKPSSPSTNSGNGIQVAFGIKDFCDQAVTDLTTVLRVGYVVKFQATIDHSLLNRGIGNKPQQRLIANFVCPVPLSEWSTVSPAILGNVKTLNSQLDTHPLESLVCEDGTTERNDRPLPYDVELELRATTLLMNIYREQGASEGPQCPLSTIHCIVSNCGNKTMYHYIGKSSQKRRNFIDRRKHFFYMTPDDTVCLVPAAVYTAITALCRELLQRGGLMKLQELFNQYLSWPDLPLEAREIVGETELDFIQFLRSHPFIFSVFPSRVFVTLQRRLPEFDYGSFLEDCFGDQEGSPLFVQQRSPATSSVNPKATSPEFIGQHHQHHHVSQENRWGEERQAAFGCNGSGNAQASALAVTSPPIFQQPTPPAFPVYISRFGHHHQNISNSQFNAPPPLPPVGSRQTSSGLGVGQWPGLQHGHSAQSSIDETAALSALANSSGVSGSNHSLSSGYSTGPMPSTPGPAQNHQFWPPAAVLGRGQIPAPENVAGFWRSYELGTESIIRQLHQSSGNQNRLNGTARGTPTPPSLSIFGSGTIQDCNSLASVGGSNRGSGIVTPETALLGFGHAELSKATNAVDGIAQTERFLLALKCGHCGVDNEWLFPLLSKEAADRGISPTTVRLMVKSKPEMVDTGVQTEMEDGGNERIMDTALESLGKLRM